MCIVLFFSNKKVQLYKEASVCTVEVQTAHGRSLSPSTGCLGISQQVAPS